MTKIVPSTLCFALCSFSHHGASGRQERVSLRSSRCSSQPCDLPGVAQPSWWPGRRGGVLVAKRLSCRGRRPGVLCAGPRGPLFTSPDLWTTHGIRACCTGAIFYPLVCCEVFCSDQIQCQAHPPVELEHTSGLAIETIGEQGGM